MAIDVTLLSDYAWSDIAKAAKMAMMSNAVGGNRLTISGRDIGRITIKEATALYELAQQQIADEASGQSGGGNVLVRYGERS
jgi:hypothetical protein